MPVHTNRPLRYQHNHTLTNISSCPAWPKGFGEYCCAADQYKRWRTSRSSQRWGCQSSRPVILHLRHPSAKSSTVVKMSSDVYICTQLELRVSLKIITSVQNVTAPAHIHHPSPCVYQAYSTKSPRCGMPDMEGIAAPLQSSRCWAVVKAGMGCGGTIEARGHKAGLHWERCDQSHAALVAGLGSSFGPAPLSQPQVP